MSVKKLLISAALGVAMSVGATVGAVAADLKVGVSWFNFQEERWKTDERGVIAGLGDGAEYISSDAGGSNEKQVSDIESLIANGANAIIVLAGDTSAVMGAVTNAQAEGIPVIGYDRLIEAKDVFYLTFDNVEVGRMQARAVFAVQPTGRYVFIKGSPTDANADFLRGGQQEVLQAAIDSGAITIVGEQYTDGWKPENAQNNMEQILTATNNGVDAVVASNDGTAGGVVAALTAQGLEGLPVSGQDGDHAALNRVARGLQTVSVWKDAYALGEAAGKIAVQLAKGEAVTGSSEFSGGPKGIAMDSILLAPVPVTKDNFNVVIDAGWIAKDVACANANDDVAACK